MRTLSVAGACAHGRAGRLSGGHRTHHDNACAQGSVNTCWRSPQSRPRKCLFHGWRCRAQGGPVSVPRSARGPVRRCSQPLSLLPVAVLLDPNPGPGDLPHRRSRSRGQSWPHEVEDWPTAHGCEGRAWTRREARLGPWLHRRSLCDLSCSATCLSVLELPGCGDDGERVRRAECFLGRASQKSVYMSVCNRCTSLYP